MAFAHINGFLWPNSVSKRQELSRWEKRFLTNHDSYGMTRLEKTRDTVDTVLQELLQPPFLQDKRFIILDGFFEEGKGKEGKAKWLDADDARILQALHNVPATNFLVFLIGAPEESANEFFRASATIKEFPLQDEQDVHALVRSKLGDHPVIASAFLACFDFSDKYRGRDRQKFEMADLWLVENELSKLAAYMRTETIRPEDVPRFVSGYSRVSIFKMLDAIYALEPKRAEGHFRTLMKDMMRDDEFVAFLSGCATNLRTFLYAVKILGNGVQERDAMDALKLKSAFQLENPKRFRGNVRQVERLFLELMEFERKVKTGGFPGIGIEWMAAFFTYLLAKCLKKGV